MYSFRKAHFATWVQRIYHVNTHTWFPPQIVNIKCHKAQIQIPCFLDILWTMLIKKLRKIMNLNFLFLHATEGDNTGATGSIEQNLTFMIPWACKGKIPFSILIDTAQFWLLPLNYHCFHSQEHKLPESELDGPGQSPFCKDSGLLLPMKTNQVIMGSN